MPGPLGFCAPARPSPQARDRVPAQGWPPSTPVRRQAERGAGLDRGVGHDVTNPAAGTATRKRITAPGVRSTASGDAANLDALVGAGEGEADMLVAVVVVAVVVLGAAGVGLVKAGRRESGAERIRVREQATVDARRTLTAVWAMNDRRFEEYIADLCRRDGCTEVQRSGGRGDLGADVVGRLPDRRRIVVQCKRYAKHRTVGSRDLQTFNGTARQEHGADLPVFVASCVFTKDARNFAARHGVVLIDVNLLGFWNSGTTLVSLAELDISRSGTNRRLAPDE